MNTLDYLFKKFNLRDNTNQVVKPDLDRKDLARLFKELGFKVGAEIGVEKGYYSETMCQKNPGVKLYCIDPWKAYKKYEDFKDQHYLDINYSITRKRLAPYNCEIIRKSSTGALKDFAPRTLDFVYIDGNHAFDYVWEDLNGWSKVVKLGGLVAGHDYHGRRNRFIGLEKAVNKYVKEHSLKLFITPKNGDSSWFFVND